MKAELTVPPLGESITEATVLRWLKQEGEQVNEGEILVELETDKVMAEIPATFSGVLEKINKAANEVVSVGDVLGHINTASSASQPTAEAKPAAKATPAPQPTQSAPTPVSTESKEQSDKPRIAPADLPPPSTIVPPSERGKTAEVVAPTTVAVASNEPTERIVPLSRLRQRIAERLLSAQHEAAILTTFNEVDMHNVMALRSNYKEKLIEKYGVAAGFMSMFTKAAVAALKEFPAVNAEIRGTDIVYKDFYHIGVAVGTERGLVVPVIRNVDSLSFIEIEQEIANKAKLARSGKLGLEDLQGGTFTISNGGVYGSMLSTPIINPPQTGILGLHNIVRRPVAVGNDIVIRPIMYVALSYDHRLIDGSEAVRFLVRIKQLIEDPQRMLFDI